jgi:hypothetical protein
MTLGGPAPSVSGFPAAGEGRSRPNRRVRAERVPTGAPRTAGKLGARPRTPRTIRADAAAAAGAAAGTLGRRSRGELTRRRRLRGVRATPGGSSPSESSLSVPAVTHPRRLAINAARQTDRTHRHHRALRNPPHAPSSLRRIGLYLTHICTYRSRARFRPILITP